MTNRGKYNRRIVIYEMQKSDEVNRLGEKVEKEVPVASFMAGIETRVGGLLSGRPADTLMTTVTHKFTWDYNNFPEILPDKHIIGYQNHRFDVNYSIDDGFKNVELQVFATEKI